MPQTLNRRLVGKKIARMARALRLHNLRKARGAPPHKIQRAKELADRATAAAMNTERRLNAARAAANHDAFASAAPFLPGLSPRRHQ